MDSFRKMIEARDDLQKYLFIRGFLLTDEDLDLSVFPFYGHWNRTEIGPYFAYTHELQKVSVYNDGSRSFFLFGHAYNPFTMEIDEAAVLRRIAESYQTDAYWDCLAEITGVYVYGIVEGEKIEYEGKPIQLLKVESHFHIASHSQLIGDLYGLSVNELTKELLAYKWYYRVMGPYLPGDMTQFNEVKRIVPSISYIFDGKSVTHERFWPVKDLSQATNREDYKKVIKEAASILKRNMELISRKWQKPYISLTGGIDSNTTFASANGIYDRFKAFSYVSAEKETIDADAAKKIAEHFNVPYIRLNIPKTEEGLKDYFELVQIMDHNSGYVAPKNDNENRKRVFLIQNLDCDVEVKSWVSETIRGYWYKHYGRKSFPSLSPKLFRNLYKIFISNRKLAHKIDRVFAEYIREFEYEKVPSCYPPADIHFNEVTWGSWGGINISDMKIYSDITFVYNNRKFFDLMFRVPLEKRINDQNHLDMKRILNKELFDMGIRIVNMKETRTRAFLLNCIFTMNCILP